MGHKLLAKMGWKEGDSLGKTNAGILEPVSVQCNIATIFLLTGIFPVFIVCLLVQCSVFGIFVCCSLH